MYFFFFFLHQTFESWKQMSVSQATHHEAHHIDTLYDALLSSRFLNWYVWPTFLVVHPPAVTAPWIWIWTSAAVAKAEAIDRSTVKFMKIMQTKKQVSAELSRAGVEMSRSVLTVCTNVTCVEDSGFQETSFE